MLSLNIFSDLQAILRYDFMAHAFEAGTVVAIVAGVIGYFAVLRRSSFAAHALSHVGFAGAAGAVLLGLSPIVGLLSFTVAGGMAIAALGRKATERDVQIGVVLAFTLGLGVLFISLYKGYATEAYSLLFGEILGISIADVWVTLIAGTLLLVLVAIFYRRLLFNSLDEEVAEAKGISIFWLEMIFMILIAIATSIAVQVVGVLLIFALMVTPAAISLRIAKTPFHGMLISLLIALFAVWFGLFISFYLSYPVSFFITTFTFMIYVIVRIAQSRNSRFIPSEEHY